MEQNTIPDGYWEDARGCLIPVEQIKEIDKARDELVREKVAKAKACLLYTSRCVSETDRAHSPCALARKVRNPRQLFLARRTPLFRGRARPHAVEGPVVRQSDGAIPSQAGHPCLS